MINRKNICIVVFLCLLTANPFAQKKETITSKVNPFIGTGGHGHTFPGATLPFGMVQLSPDTYNDGWDWCSGYHESDNSIMGFSHTHLSGTGCADYGDILLMPTTGEVKLVPGTREKPGEGYRSTFKHQNEKASPGYYSVLLDDYKVKAELTATLRTGLHKYSFPKTEQANIVIDLAHGIGNTCSKAVYKIISNTEIEGSKRTHGWNGDRTIYFVAKFSKPFKSYGISVDGKLTKEVKTGEGKVVKGYVQYSTNQDEVVYVKVGISHTDVNGARKNLETEQKDFNFDKVKKNAEAAWEKELSRIKVEGGTKDQATIFYTAMYHSYVAPNTYSDADGRHKGMDGKIYTEKNQIEYTCFSLWDTFRALHPLLTITNQKRTNDIINTFYNKYKESGLLPVWELAGWETNCMIGYHSIPVIFDAYMKGIRKYDAKKLFVAMKHSAEVDQFGLKSYRESGYVQSNKASQAVSRTLEYAYDDWCIAKMAEALGEKADFERYSKRALSYANIFDGSTGFMRGKIEGNFVTPFNPYAVTGDYTEANAWQYNLFVPHDVKGLMNMFGGKNNFAKRVHELFTAESKLDGHAQSDITGLVGQYAHGNEPSHHMAYLYTYAGEGYKTQETVRKIMDELYFPKPAGLSGNEDCGQMSAWFVLSAMGFYPACPGTNQYVIGSPIFSKITIELENGKHFVINAKNNSAENKYIQSVSKNGTAYKLTYIKHEDLMKGSEFTFTMGKEPNKTWGTDESALPYSFTQKAQVSVPYMKADETVFLESTEATLGCLTEGAEIRYTTDGTAPVKTSALYTKPITIKENTTIKFAAFKEGFVASPVSSGSFEKAKYVEAKTVTGLTSGLAYDYYEGDFNSVFQMVKTTPKKSGVTDVPKLALKQKEEGFGFKFTGYINVPKDGMYKFYTKTDDGSMLYIDEQKVVSNDGPHGATSITGYIALKAGYHTLSILFYQGGGDAELEAGVEGPGIKLQQLPKEWLFK